MFPSSTRQFAENLLKKGDIRINGSRSWDMQIHDERMFSRAVHYGSLGLGEAYMAGWWDAKELDQFFFHLLQAGLEEEIRMSPKLLVSLLANVIGNPQRHSRAFTIGKRHYDIGNEVYQTMLDRRLTYTCGYWPNASTLDEAQEAKLELVCRKLQLKSGMHVLDIGCGWGSFAKFAAQQYGVSVVGITVSKEQVALGQQLCSGLPIEIRLEDYRDIGGTYDRIVSLGMFEHVGYKNYRTFMQKVRGLLARDGLFLLHTIGRNHSGVTSDPWIETYIFPRSILPSIKQVGAAIEDIFVMEDWHNFGADYDKTLMAWFANFQAGWPKLKGKYDERFYRMWKYYLLSCAGSFRVRRIQLWQVVLSPRGVVDGYTSIRE